MSSFQGGLIRGVPLCISSTDVVTDAMGIYSTYIALNALTPVHIPDDVRQRVEGIYRHVYVSLFPYVS